MREEPATARDAVIVVILPDGGRNYLSKLYNDEWMRVNGMLATAGAVVRVGRAARATATTATSSPTWSWPGRRIGSARRSTCSSSTASASCPVSEQPDGDALEGIVGSVSEKGLLDRAYRDPSVVERTVGEVMDRPLPTLDVAATPRRGVRAAVRRRRRRCSRSRAGRPRGVVTKLDLLEYLAHRTG